MARVSLLLNLLVLTPVCTGLVRNARWVQASYGPDTPARSILLAVYVSIALASAWLLVSPDLRCTALLLSLQIVYKMMTPVTVRTLRNPVVVSNLAIAGFHAVTLVVIWPSMGSPPVSP